MNKNRIIFTSGKESFVVRVLIKKVNDMGIDCAFVPFEIDELSEEIKDVSLVSVYLDDDTRASSDKVHFLSEQLGASGGQIILIGEQAYINSVGKSIPDGLIYDIFPRPVNNDEYAYAVRDYFRMESAGELKKKILIVDDDPQYLNLVREWLKDTYKVSMANSGLQAIKLLGKDKVDLILLDYEMPVTTGPQVLEMLRSDDDTKSIPVMFLTSKSDKQSVMEVVELRPEAYFLKSIQKDELMNKLREYFLNKG